MIILKRLKNISIDNFVWTDEMQLIGEKLQKVDKELNGKLENELADQLLKE